MKKVINLYKRIGETPLEAIKKFREKYSHYKTKKMGYAGRLDPMAEGVLIVLVEDENKRIGEYMRFDKEYNAEILFGFSTDSHDVLGIPEKCEDLNIDIKELKKKMKNFRGTYEQKIPKFSSYKIEGKPMFYYARKGINLEDVRKNVFIKNIKINSFYKISSKKLSKYISMKINKLNGDFRQKEILDRWSTLLEGNNFYYVLNVDIECSSGTYIRAIADDLGRKVNSGGLLLSLKRTRVGKFMIRDSLRLN